MTTGQLLEALINLSQITKTDFALSTYMSPSSLSLILSGKRLPGSKDRHAFTRNAAHALSEALYGYQCYRKLQDIFPIIFDFASQYELESFLQFALDYTLDRDTAIEEEQNLDYPRHAVTYLRDRHILNMVCIIISDYLLSGEDADLEFFSYLPLQAGAFDPIFRRIIITGRGSAARLTYNQALDMSGTRPDLAVSVDTLQYMKRFEEHSDLVFWEITELTGEPFLMLKDRFILLLNEQADHNLTMTFITHKSFVHNFYSGLCQGAQKVSFNPAELLERLQADPQTFRRIADKITSVYTFCPIGFLLTEDEIDLTGAPSALTDGIHKLFQLLLNRNINFYVSDVAVNAVINEGEAIVPLCGTVQLPPEERIAFLSRLTGFVQGKDHPRFRLLSSALSDFTIVCAGEQTLVYSIDHRRERERVHLFHTDRFEAAIEQRISESDIPPISYSDEQWLDFMLEKSDSL